MNRQFRPYLLGTVSHRALSLGGGPDVYPALMRAIFIAGRTLGAFKFER